MSNRVRYQKKGFSFASFLLGILFGIILLLGAVGGVIAFVLFTDIDTVFDTVGMQNKDDEGNYIYINTDPDNGGAKTLLDLVGVVGSYASDFGNRSLGELEDIVPAVSGLVNKVEEQLREYVEVDMEKLRASKFSELGQFLTDTVMDIKPATLIEKSGVDTGGDGVASTLMSAIMYGSETDYVEVDGVKYPVMYEKVEVAEPARTARDAEPDGDGVATVKHYFYKLGENYYVAFKGADGEYTATTDVYTPAEPKYTGHYYYANGDDAGEKIIVTPVTLRLISSDDGMQEILDGVIITDLINQEGMIEDILGGVSIGEIVSGEVNIDEKVKNLQIASIIDVDPESTIMAYLGYGLSGVAAVDGQSYQYTATLDGKTVFVTADADPKKITGVYEDAALTVKIDGTTVNGVSDRIDNAKIDVFMEIKPTDKLMMFIAYGVSGVVEVENDEYSYIGNYKMKGGEGEEDKTVTCYIVTNGDKISTIYYLDEEMHKHNVDASTIENIGDRVNDIAVDAFLDIKPGDKLLMYIGYGVTGVVEDENHPGSYTGSYKGENMDAPVTCHIETVNGNITRVYYTNDDNSQTNIPAAGINDISGRINNITVDVFLDIKPDDALMMYIAYGVSGIVPAENGNGYVGRYKPEGATEPVDCRIETQGDKITAVYWSNDDGSHNIIPAAGINDISGRISGITDELAISELMDIDNDNAIMMYIAYGVYKNDNGELVYKVGENDERPVTVTLKDGSDKVISSIYYMDGGVKKYVPGTPVNGISGRVSELKNDLTIGEVLGEISPDNKILYALRNSKIGNLNDAVNDLELSVFIGENNSNSILKALEKTTVKNLGTRVGELTLQELYPEDIYVSKVRFEVTEDKFSKGYVYYTKNTDESFTLAGNNGKVESWSEGLWTYGEIGGVWKFLLTDYVAVSEETGYYNEKLCDLNGIGSLMNNAANNINNAKLADLQSAGIIDANADLSKKLSWVDSTGSHSVVLSQMSLHELINAVISLSTAASGS